MGRVAVVEHEMEDNMELQYFTRTRGIFRVCFPESERPLVGTPGLFLNLVEEWCFSREYMFTPLLRGVWHPANMSAHGVIQLHLSRTTPCLFALYLFFMCIMGILGLSGCWNQSSSKLIATAAVQLFSALVGACAMATWHAALFMEMEKVYEPGFPLTWPLWLQQASSVSTGWSYIMSWTGICLTLLASLATSASAICLRAQRRDWEEHTMRMKLSMRWRTTWSSSITPEPGEYSGSAFLENTCLHLYSEGSGTLQICQPMGLSSYTCPGPPHACLHSTCSSCASWGSSGCPVAGTSHRVSLSLQRLYSYSQLWWVPVPWPPGTQHSSWRWRRCMNQAFLSRGHSGCSRRALSVRGGATSCPGPGSASPCLPAWRPRHQQSAYGRKGEIGRSTL